MGISTAEHRTCARYDATCNHGLHHVITYVHMRNSYGSSVTVWKLFQYLSVRLDKYIKVLKSKCIFGL